MKIMNCNRFLLNVIVILFIAFNISYFLFFSRSCYSRENIAGNEEKQPYSTENLFLNKTSGNSTNHKSHIRNDYCSDPKIQENIAYLIKRYGCIVRDRNSTFYIYLPKEIELTTSEEMKDYPRTKILSNFTIDDAINIRKDVSRYIFFGDILDAALEINSYFTFTDRALDGVLNSKRIPTKTIDCRRYIQNISLADRYQGSNITKLMIENFLRINELQAQKQKQLRHSSYCDESIYQKRNIPRYIWISQCSPKNSVSRRNIKLDIDLLQAMNPCYLIQIYTCEDQENFMHKYYANTSILSAYLRINPQLPAAQADIWRLAILYKFGGIYMDSDVKINPKSSIHFDQFIDSKHDQMILTQEKSFFYHEMTDGIYSRYQPPNHHLRQNLQLSYSQFTARRILSTWLLISAPQHPFLGHALNISSQLIEDEFFCRSNIQLCPNCARMDRIWFITGPVLFTTAVRDVIYQSYHQPTSVYYREYFDIRSNQSQINQMYRIFETQNFAGIGLEHIVQRSYGPAMSRYKINLLHTYFNSSVDNINPCNY